MKSPKTNSQNIKSSINFLPNKINLEQKKKQFLYSIKGSKNKYKRYSNSPLRYAGGKSLAVGFIAELLPNNINKIVSPFIGGASFEIACNKELGLEVVGYDIFDILINYWDIQINFPIKLFNALKKIEPTKNNYQKIKEKLKQHWKDEVRLGSFDLALHYYFNHNLSYGPGFLGWMSSIYEDKTKYYAALEKVKNFSVENFSVAKKTFEESIPKHKNDFLYCDPPYFLEGDSKMFRGIYPQRNFPIHHNGFNHFLLHELLMKHKGGFILSYNDCSEIRKLYKDCKIIDVSWQYTMGQGETRIGKNRKNENRDHVKNSHEILIVKYD